jgi:selenocysteine-specific elongation factor
MERFALMIIGTAGHIDHGKTSLVRALTGVDTDRLKEEKERGISIELGYAYAPVAGGQTLAFIDVPGHERLVHTMVAGAGGIDFALLVIAADDGVMPQTREHLAILDLMGVRRGAVAISKVDRVAETRSLAVAAEIKALLAPTPLRQAPLFALNAAAPDDPGVAALSSHLIDIALSCPMRSDEGLFRLAVDRVYSAGSRHGGNRHRTGGMHSRRRYDHRDAGRCVGSGAQHPYTKPLLRIRPGR